MEIYAQTKEVEIELYSITYGDKSSLNFITFHESGVKHVLKTSQKQVQYLSKFLKLKINVEWTSL